MMVRGFGLSGDRRREGAAPAILLVEDSYLLAQELAVALGEAGVAVAGPVATADDAMRLIDEGGRLDAAVLDINLGDEMIYRVADRLQARGTPFVFVSGLGAALLPRRYATATRIEKPVDIAGLLAILLG